MPLPTQLTLTQEMERIDEIDNFLIDDVLLIVQNTMTMEYVKFWGHSKLNQDKANEKYYIKIQRCVNALLKANALRRNYLLVRDEIIKEISSDPSLEETNIDLQFNKVDAFILIEAFFTQIKTSLDLFAQSLQPIYGVRFHTFERKNDISGMNVVNQLKNNLSSELKPHAIPLVKLIENNAEIVTTIVKHRDDTVHYGKITNVQGFRYSVDSNKISQPAILVKEDEAMYVEDYMADVLNFISEFIQAGIITVLSNMLPDMQPCKETENSWGWCTKGEGVFPS